MTDFLFRGSLAELDPGVFELNELEAERQARKLILIPSESQAPLAVREALASAFQNIYAEGYPDEESRGLEEADILDYRQRLADYRRYSDPRYYKGVEYADLLEMLARHRCARAFAANGLAWDDLYVNVQPLSGAPANNAVYHALANPGDTILGMSLLHGGHLTHGSSANRSGKYYHAVHYTIDPKTEQIDYDQVEELACQHRPKFIIAGYSSYPWMVDWARFSRIAHSVGAYLFADIAHVAGLVAAGVYPSPVGYADVITLTTHKSLCGPRGACILTADPLLARKIDRAVFPGEQGGPHVNVFAAMALTFKLAQTEQFCRLQQQVVKNCAVFTNRLREHGFCIAYGGTNTHLVNLDCGAVKGPDGVALSGDQGARILDLAGIVANRNTIPGDRSAADPSGIRMGTLWVTQRGLMEKEMVAIADIISDLFKATTSFVQPGRRAGTRRSRVDFTALENARLQVRSLAAKAGLDFLPAQHGYPHFYYLDDIPETHGAAFEIGGERARSFLNFALSSDVEALLPGQSQATCLVTPQGDAEGYLACLEANCFVLDIRPPRAGVAAAWLRDLSDGFIYFDDDPLRKMPGTIWVHPARKAARPAPNEATVGPRKPYYIGMSKQDGRPLPAFEWREPAQDSRRTALYGIHQQLGARFTLDSGWEMPWEYSSVLEEYQAVRQAAGLFDVTHMGVYQVEGPDGAVFLDSVAGNDIGGLEVGASCHAHFLAPDAQVLDDVLVYRRQAQKYLVVVNASNDDKDWAWLNAVKDGQVRVSSEHPGAWAYGRGAILRNLRHPQAGADQRVDLALQGPRSRDVLLAAGCTSLARRVLLALKRTQACEVVIDDFDLVVARTGYTGEKMGFELFVHPDQAGALFQALLRAGEPFGLQPAGLAARNALRIEAGLPLFGHELGQGSGQLGSRNLGVAEAGFAACVKTYKPWFIGREAYLKGEKSRRGEVVRFRFAQKNARMAHQGDPVLDPRGKVVGWVTSCAGAGEGHLTGQAYVDLQSATEGTSLLVYPGAPLETGKAPANLLPGDQMALPSPVVVISRFLKQAG